MRPSRYGRPTQRREDQFLEEYAYVLDFLPQGNPLDKHPVHRVNPVAQIIGTRFFTLLEVHPKPGVTLEIGEKVYIGKGIRDKIGNIFGRIDFEDLTSIAQSNLKPTIKKIILEQERVFVEFFNIAQAITLKLHALELLPGIGKKHLVMILEERKRGSFKNFEDLKKRTRIQDPADVLAERIIEELKGGQKYYLFIKPKPGTQAIFLNYLGILYKRSSGESL